MESKDSPLKDPSPEPIPSTEVGFDVVSPQNLDLEAQKPLERIHLILSRKSQGAITLFPLRKKKTCVKCQDRSTSFELDEPGEVTKRVPKCLSCILYKDIHLRIKPPKIGDLLRDAGVITQDQINTVLTAKREQYPTKLFGEILVELRLFTPAQILAIFAFQYDIEYIDLTPEKINPIALKSFPKSKFKDGYPRELYKQYQVICFDKHYQTYSIGMVDHLNDDALLAVARALGRTAVSITPFLISLNHFVALSEDQTKALEVHQLSKTTFVEPKEEVLDVEESFREMAETAYKEDDAFIHEQFLRILREAIRSRASDIRYEFTDKVFRVRFRIDGKLTTFETYPKAMGRYILNKIRLESKVDVIRRKDERADGSFPINLDERTYNLRTCFMPSVYEQLCVVRILYRQELAKDLRQLGLSARSTRLLRDATERPHGLVVLAGPMGSGKTTTLYSLIYSKSVDDTLAVVSLEEPVEFILPNITQIPIDGRQVHSSYESILPGILRVDPDIVMVGETRDRNSAENVYRLALIGKLVFTSVHANDSPGVISRFLNLGIEPYQIAASTILIISQRLVRTLCQNCKKEKEVSETVLRNAGFDYRYSYPASVYEAAVGGCVKCKGTGYRGRTAITEALEISSAIEKLILEKASEQEIRRQAIKDGMVTLKSEGLGKILESVTSIEEVLAVTGKQEDPTRHYQVEEEGNVENKPAEINPPQPESN
ncbi:Flp pilus assembly complex ATPase component TadA [bacterium]|nr:Flp pilus assembly complex ATPase component TadA [bacterium]MCI0601951.1 Flp pilus assembly complex ATPase component TadA [bacterium]